MKIFSLFVDKNLIWKIFWYVNFKAELNPDSQYSGDHNTCEDGGGMTPVVTAGEGGRTPGTGEELASCCVLFISGICIPWDTGLAASRTTSASA